MRKSIILAAAVLAAVSCQQAPKETVETAEVAPEEENTKVTFVEENIPAQGLDVNAYSKGIQHIGIPTANVQKTIDFYQGLGFTLATRHDINGRDFAFMQLGNCLIEVIPNDDPAMVNGAVDHICLDVKNIDELFAKIKEAGYNMVDESINDIAFWENGARYFFILGPNNERIEFCEVL